MWILCSIRANMVQLRLSSSTTVTNTNMAQPNKGISKNNAKPYNPDMLNGSTYTWYTTQHYAIGTGNAYRLTWEHLKFNLQSYFNPPDYAYQIWVALLHCKQSGNIASYICVFLQHLNRCSDFKETEAFFCFVEGLFPEVEHCVWLQQARTLQHAL